MKIYFFFCIRENKLRFSKHFRKREFSCLPISKKREITQVQVYTQTRTYIYFLHNILRTACYICMTCKSYEKQYIFPRGYFYLIFNLNSLRNVSDTVISVYTMYILTYVVYVLTYWGHCRSLEDNFNFFFFLKGLLISRFNFSFKKIV